MRILHITKKYPNAIGGDATCVFHLEKYQQKKGYKVFILTTNCDEIVANDNLYKFGLCGMPYDWDQITLKRIISLLFFIPRSLVVIRKIKPDIIYSHSADLGFIGSLWAKLLKIKITNICHTLNFPYKFISKVKRYPELISLKYGFFNKIITVDPNNIKFFHNYSIRNCQYLNIYGVDIEEFERVNRNIDLSEKRKYKRIIFVGRLDHLKGLDYLIESAAELKNSLDYFEVWIIGDGPYKKHLKEISHKLEVEKYIKLFNTITSREELFKMYCLADIFVLPSLLESFPLSMLEAWAANLAVVITNVGAISKICKDGENALIIQPRDAKSLSLALLKLIKDDNLCKKIGTNGKNLVKEYFAWDIVLRNLEKI